MGTWLSRIPRGFASISITADTSFKLVKHVDPRQAAIGFDMVDGFALASHISRSPIACLENTDRMQNGVEVGSPGLGPMGKETLSTG